MKPVLNWPKVVMSPEAKALKETCTDTYRYLLWLRRTMLCHVTSREYQVARGMVQKYAMRVYNQKPAKYQRIEIEKSESVLKSHRQVVLS